MKFGYSYSRRDYADRPAHSADGSLPASNPDLAYSYHRFETTLRSTLGRHWNLYLDYALRLRGDEYVGYNDYVSNELKLRAYYRINKRVTNKLSVTMWDRDYPHAYAFDAPAQGAKVYDGIEAQAKSEWKSGRSGMWWAQLTYDAQNSSDNRYQYDRYQLMIGGTHKF